MLLIMLIAAAYLYSSSFAAIPAARARQLQLKSAYLYRTLELSQIGDYSVSYFQAIAENLVEVGEPAVPGEVIENRLLSVLEFLKPSDCGVLVELSYENRSWVEVVPENASPAGDEYSFTGTVTLVIAEAENRVAQVVARVSLFRI